MQSKQLYLSHWKESIPMCVSSNVVEKLTNYQIMGVRFLFSCFQKGYDGAILNPEENMLHEIQVAAFLNSLHKTISPEYPVLIVTSESRVCSWHYHLVNDSKNSVTLLSEINYLEVLEAKHTINLCSMDDLKLLQNFIDVNFFIIVVDQFDTVANKLIFKRLKGKFRVGITHRNFLKRPDQKLLWTMLNWSNPNVVGKFSTFVEEDTEHTENLRNAYDTWWQRLTWNLCDNFKKPTNIELQEYKSILQDWFVQQNLPYREIMPKCKSKASKRKIDQSKCSSKKPLIVPESKLKNNGNNKKNCEAFLTDRTKLKRDVNKNNIAIYDRTTCHSDRVKNKKGPSGDDSNSQACDFSEDRASSQETVIYSLSEDDIERAMCHSVKVNNKKDCSGDDSSSQRTIAYDYSKEKASSQETVTYSYSEDEDDENFILTSLIKNSPTSARSRSQNNDNKFEVRDMSRSNDAESRSNEFKTCSTYRYEGDSDILTNIIKGKKKADGFKGGSTKTSRSKLLTQIYGDTEEIENKSETRLSATSSFTSNTTSTRSRKDILSSFFGNDDD